MMLLIFFGIIDNGSLIESSLNCREIFKNFETQSEIPNAFSNNKNGYSNYFANNSKKSNLATSANTIFCPLNFFSSFIKVVAIKQ
jgi:hypothetical protein